MANSVSIYYPMDPYARSWYQLKFQNTFLRLKGTAFQDFFADIMSRCHPDDFIRTRPWGSIGDQKNDGYLKSEKTLFQVYAPNEMTAAAAVAKITEDFEGSLPYWEAFFRKWVFVHNALDGLGPDIVRCLLELEEKNTNVTVGQMGYESLEEKVLRLEQRHLESILGYGPDARAVSCVRSADLINLLDHLSQSSGVADVEIRPVSINKINKNSLSEESKQYLRMGQRKSNLVIGIFDSFPDPLAAERIVQGFRNKYLDLKLQNIDSNRILSALIAHTGGYAEHYKGGAVEAQKHEAAVSSILAYLFERCDIFEDPDVEDEH